MTEEPIGNVLDAAVKSLGSYGSPLAVRSPAVEFPWYEALEVLDRLARVRGRVGMERASARGISAGAATDGCDDSAGAASDDCGVIAGAAIDGCANACCEANEAASSMLINASAAWIHLFLKGRGPAK